MQCQTWVTAMLKSFPQTASDLELKSLEANILKFIYYKS